ncbi:MAG: stage II sporulation protein R [Clostridia bacterium]|nr:stage II sporulation protein R [Clostridia bacterium]
MKIRKWEIALAVSFILSLLIAAPVRIQADLQSKLTRLHVVANSDSEEDQALKMRVRDAVLKAASGYESVCPELLSDIEKAAQDAAGEYKVSVSCGEEWFDTRRYDTFSLPCGRYNAVRVTIGEGKGKNFWCVVFPPLCAAVSEKELSAVPGLTGKEISFVTEDGAVCVVGFKIAELWGRVSKYVNFFEKS